MHFEYALMKRVNQVEQEKHKHNLLMILSSSGPGPGPRSGPGQVPGKVQKVQGLRAKDLDLGYTLNLVCHPPTTTH